MTRMFNFELWAEPPPETVGALCARRAHDWMVIDMGEKRPSTFRCGSFGQFVHDDGVSGTLDCQHAGAVGNGTPCLVVHHPAAGEPAPAATTNSNGGHAMPTIAASEWRGPQGEKDRNGGYVLQRVTGNNSNEVLPTFVAADSKGVRPHSARDGKYVLHTFRQVSGGSNPQVCGTLAARDGFKTGPRTPNGQDAYDGKLIVASFDPYEPGGVKTVRQDGAACTVVNGTCAGWHGAVIQFEEAAQ